MNYEPLIDRLTTFYAHPGYQEEVGVAKAEFFDHAGVVDEENPSFELRITQFWEWYLFTRWLKDYRMTPAEYALEVDGFPMTHQERPEFERLASTRQSIFRFEKIRGADIYAYDLFYEEPLIVPNSPVQVGFSREEYFSARLVSGDGAYHFTKGFCFHPVEAATYINKEIKSLQKIDDVTLKDAFFLKLLKMRYKYEQYRHLKIEHVYTNEKKVKF